MVVGTQRGAAAQNGIVLVSSLLLLLVVTIMALSIFRSFGVQAKIAGNTRDKQRALQAAVSTQAYAESWLTNTSNAVFAVNVGLGSSADVICVGQVTTPQICNNTLVSRAIPVTGVPWAAAGVSYTPAGMSVTGAIVGAAVTTDIYYGQPRFYIADVGTPASGHGELYTIDAYSYGVSANTIAVVESTVAITCIVCNLGAQ